MTTFHSSLALRAAACVGFVSAAVSAAVFADVPSTRPASPDRFHYAGVVVDGRGAPIANATVAATIRERDSAGYAYIDQVATDAAGHFTIDRAVALSGQPRGGLNANATIWLECNDADHLLARREDLATLSADALATLRVSMEDGRTQAGRVVDPAGRPVADALVHASFGDADWLAGKGAITDANGRFAIHGLPAKPGSISALVVGSAADRSLQAATTPLPATADAITLTVAPVHVAPADARDVLGMKLATLDAMAADALGRPGQTGVLILDPGNDVARLHLGDVKAGDVFWIVGDAPVKTVNDFVRELLVSKQPTIGGATCRVVYRFRRPDFDGTNTQHLLLTPADLATLRPGDAVPAK